MMLRALAFFALAALSATSAWAQRPTGEIRGAVYDPSGTVVPKATITITDKATGITKTAISGDNGSFLFLNLLAGTYDLSVRATGFQTSVHSGLVVDTGRATELRVELRLGTVNETVEVTGEAALLETSVTQVANTIRNDFIKELPLAGRNTLDFARLAAGAVSAAGTTTFNNLPLASLNVSVDGANINDSRYRSGAQGFSTLSPVRLDAMEEVTIATAGTGADAAAGGAMNITLTTKRGTSKYHGSLFEQFVHDKLAANSFFNNMRGIARTRQHLNDFGGNLGGPLPIPFARLKNKLFFFVNYEDAPRPATTNRTATLLTQEAQSGVYRFVGTDGLQHTANLLQVAAAAGYPGTIDPTVASAMKEINGTTGSGTLRPSTSDLYTQSLTWVQDNSQRNYFPTARLDYQITDKLAWHGSWNLRHEHQNGNGPAYPGLGLNSGEFKATRYSLANGLDYAVKPNLFNSFKYGLQSSISANNIRNSVYQWAPQGDRRITYGTGIGNFIPNATPLIRGNPTHTLSDDVNWIKGKHVLKFGGSRVYSRFYESDYYQFSGVLNWSLGIATTDPINSVFAASTIPFLRTQDEATAKQLYATLAGRVSSISGFRNINEATREYEKYAPLVYRESYTSWGLFFQDSYRFTSDLTFNFGLRWEFTGVMTNTNNTFMSPRVEDLVAPSSAPFQVGNVSNRLPSIDQRSVTYAPDRVNPAPNFGFAWNPKFSGGALGRLFGNHKTVIRGSYGINYFDEGLNVDYWVNTNAGNWQSLSASPGTEFTAGSVTLRSPEPTLNVSPALFRPPFDPAQFAFGNYNVGTTAGKSNGPGNLPTMRNPYVQNWSFGIQREVAKDTLLEVRYAGNKVTHKWKLYNIQEVNIFENGFLSEFRNAQKNLEICTANRAACTGSATGALRFDNRGLPGQVALPILEAAFGPLGSQPALALGSGFTSGTFVTNLTQGNAGTLANTLSGTTRTNASYYCRLVGSTFSPCTALGYNAPGRYPVNFFKANPYYADLTITDDNSWGNYHGLQVELRKRFSHGLSAQGNYTLSHSIGDYGVSETLAQNYSTIRNRDLDKAPSPFDLRHAFRFYGTYSLPFGKNRRFAANGAVLDRIVGGWTLGGVLQATSGRLSGRMASSQRTFNNLADSGIILNGLTVKELEQKLRVIRDNPNGQTLYGADASLIGADGRANPQYLGLPSTPGQFGQFVYTYGPRFISLDSSISKEIRIRERVRLQFQGEFINVLNHPVFSAPTSNLSSTSFGQVSSVQVAAREIQLRGYLRW